MELTVAHGGWQSEGHTRYERFSQLSVLGIPAGMLGLRSGFGVPGQAREVSRTRTTRGVSGVAESVPQEESEEGASGSDDAEPVASFQAVRAADGVPPGYTPVRHEFPSGTRGLWLAPDGSKHPSRPAAWRHFVKT